MGGDPVHDSLKNAETELKIEHGISQVNASDGYTHNSLGLSGGGWDLRVSPDLPVFRIVFVDNSRKK